MRRFIRREKPDYWSSWERRWLVELRDWARGATALALPSAKDRAWRWQRGGRTLAQRFRDEVWIEEAPRLCAYCDGPLDETSPTTIDHFIPESLCPKLGVFWNNLFPCCSSCNSTHKKTQFSPDLLRPDREDLDSYLDVDPETGALSPAPELPPEAQERARVTIAILGLNEGGRPRARRLRWRELNRAIDERGMFTLADIQENARVGPYRIVAERLLAAKLGEDGEPP